MCEPFNSKEFSDSILYLLELPHEATEMGRLARKTTEERFDWRIVVKKLLSVYAESLRYA
jgi:glycosyltransferase involved in cell wall biosynthesis